VPRTFSAARDEEARWWLVSLPARVGVLLVAFLAVVAGGVFIVVHYFLGGPQTIAFGTGVSPNTGATVNVVMQEDPQNDVSAHPDWVSYFVQDPTSHQWVHTTLFQVPAGSKIDMTILAYDGCTPLRNNYWGKVTGTTGNVAYENGKPFTQLNSYSGCNVAHTFSIPGVGLNVPMGSPTLAQIAKPGLCGSSPCTTSNPHQVMTFSFTSPSSPGDYFWQCRIPCGGGFIDGFGGPMQTLGYMTGNMVVVN
jgi:hypothetical protein